jgi:hypothetical protein
VRLYIDRDNIFSRITLLKKSRPCAALSGAIFHLGNIANADGHAATRPKHDVGKLIRRRHAPQGPEAELLWPGDHAAARRLDVFPLQGLAHIEHSKVMGRDFLCVEQHANLARLPSVEADAAHAIDPLNSAAHLFICDLGQLAETHRAADQNGHDRVRLRIFFCDDGW